MTSDYILNILMTIIVIMSRRVITTIRAIIAKIHRLELPSGLSGVLVSVQSINGMPLH